MTRVLILGASGMLGHKFYQVCAPRFETWAAVRGAAASYARYHLFEADRLLGGVDAVAPATVSAAVRSARPDVVINAAGITKQRLAARDPVASITVNALFPHQLAALCRETGARLIHLSTDCVYSGRRGMYTEDDPPDPDDLYGRSKLLGEVSGKGCLVLRTSMIGRELNSAHGLVEWFLSHRGGRVRGYTQAVFSGLPTIVLARLLADVIERHPALSGLFHVSAAPIDKCSLLRLLRDAYGAPVEIDPFPQVRVDRSLDSRRFREATGFDPPAWSALVHEMAVDSTPYEIWRRGHVA